MIRVTLTAYARHLSIAVLAVGACSGQVGRAQNAAASSQENAAAGHELDAQSKTLKELIGRLHAMVDG